MSQTIKIYKNDTSPNVTFTITRLDGTVVNLTGATIRFRIQDPVTGLRTNDAANTCSIVNAATGVCAYAWATTDLPDAGAYTANLQITFQDGQVETYGITINVTDIV